jgi:hypothetical protein
MVALITSTRETAPEYRWADLLAEAVGQPGTISQCYSLFWNYSMGNMLAALHQCLMRGIQPGPINTFLGWKQLDRQVRKGERAMWLCMPITWRRQPNDRDDQDDQTADIYTRFTWRPRWFVLGQTDGAEYTPPELPGWDRERALAALGITEEPFSHMNGNAQGYSRPGRVLAINPLAEHPARTLLHEVAHILLGHLDTSRDLPAAVMEVEAEATAYLVGEALGLVGADDSRGYVQHYLAKGAHIEETTARRIYKTADAILHAGREPFEPSVQRAA